LVVVPHNTLPGEIHWLWYRMTHCQVKYIGRGTVWHIARWKALVIICHTVPQLVYFTWQCVIRYHNQCIPAGNVLCGTTSSVFQLAMCYTVPQPMYFTWQCAMQYHDQCLSPSNVSYGTTTNAFYLTMCLTVPRPVNTLTAEIHWMWYRITHCQLEYTGCGTVWHIARWNTLVVVPYDILLGCTGRGTAWHIARWKALVVVLYDTLSGEIHWLRYRIAHCQVKYTGCGTT
jgi:hypothetical protein